MPYTAAQLNTFYTNLHLGKVPGAADLLKLDGYALQNQGGGLTDAQTLKLVADTGDTDTAVAVLTYQFFTGSIPSAAGLAYLVNSAGNTTDLNDAYYQGFNLENRYINFASNLGIAGAGAAAFAAAYGSITFDQAVDLAYDKIVGSSFASGVSINPAAAKADIKGRLAYFTALANANFPGASAATKDLAIKAGMIGYIMAEAMKADVGVYAAGANAFMTDLMLDGSANFAVDLIPVYGVPASTAGLAKTFQLTNGIDIGAAFAGAGGDDIFFADLDALGNQTLNGIDSLDGGGGTNTLIATLKADVSPAGLANMQIIQVSNIANGVGGNSPDLNLLNATGVTTIKTGSNADPDGIVISNIPTAVKDYQISNNAGPVTFQVDASALSGTDEATVLGLSGVTAGAVTIGSGAVGSGYKTITVNSVGSDPNTLTTLTDGASDKLTTIKFSGTQNLTITNVFDTTVKTVDGTGFKGMLNLNLSAASVLTVTGGDGDDTFNFGASYVGGSTGATRDTVDGGKGMDTIATTHAILGGLTTAQANVTNVERLLVTDNANTAFDSTLFAGVTEIAFANGSGAVVTVDSGDTISMLAGSGFAPNPTIAGFGLADTLTYKLASGISMAGSIFGSTGVEILTVTSTGLAGTTNNFGQITMAPTLAAETVKFTGAASMTAGGAITADIIDASGLTGTAALTMSAATIAVNGAAISGSAGADTLLGSTQADLIIGGGGNDKITGGAGADQIDISAGGSVTITLTGILAQADGDKISGFLAGTGAGVDKVTVNAADTSAATLATSDPAVQQVLVAPAAPTLFTTTTADVLELAFNLSGNNVAGTDLDNFTDGTGLLAALGQLINVQTNGDKGFIVAYQGGNAYLYYAEDASVGGNLAASEIHLVGTFSNVAVGAFEATNIDLI